MSSSTNRISHDIREREIHRNGVDSNSSRNNVATRRMYRVRLRIVTPPRLFVIDDAGGVDVQPGRPAAGGEEG